MVFKNLYNILIANLSLTNAIIILISANLNFKTHKFVLFFVNKHIFPNLVLTLKQLFFKWCFK